MTEIKFVQQPTGDSCTSACLSMLTGIPIDEVIEKFHSDWKAKKSNPAVWLNQNGFNYEVNHNPFCHTAEWGSVYLLTVPSLNIVGGLHHIVMDLRSDTEVILDPNYGKVGKKYYTGWSVKSESLLAVKLSAFLIDLTFIPQAAKRQEGE